jgi:hypothetical protein
MLNHYAKRVLSLVVVICAASLPFFYARARANAPTGRYVVTTTTVLDTETNLLWQQAAASTAMGWADAGTYCAGLGATLGGTGWRLPTAKELMTLFDFSMTSMSVVHLDPTAFSTAAPDARFWSSTIYPSKAGSARHVTLTSASIDADAETVMVSVRCVR